MSNTYFLAWWNLENLFDVQGAPYRPDWLQEELQEELEGWTQEILDRKLTQLGSVISAMNGGDGPDLLGVCEVENKRVLKGLVDDIETDRSYGVAHHSADDGRGIDVAFIYDEDWLTPGQEFDHVIRTRNATRDLWQVNFETPNGQTLIAVGNHWPSRSGGRRETEPYRIMAGETLSYWHQRILEETGEAATVVMMGDFNDEPHNRSITEYALGRRSRLTVENARKTPFLWNLSWPMLGKGVGTYYYSNDPYVLDQFLVSGPAANKQSHFTVQSNRKRLKSKETLEGEGLNSTQKKLFETKGPVRLEIPFVEMIDRNGEYPDPVRFGRPSDELHRNGYSDHYPISLVLQEQ